MKNYKLTIRYDGSNFYGWNPQTNYPSILKSLSSSLQSFYNKPCKIYGSGRTDRGVHALNQVASCHLDIDFSILLLKKMWNKHLPKAIRIIDIKMVNKDFHARYSALSKTYKYQIILPSKNDAFNQNYYYIYDFSNWDFKLLQKGIDFFCQKNNFLSFSSLSLKEQKDKDFIREIIIFSLTKSSNKITFLIEGNGFLKHMVRKIIGTLIALGEKKINLIDLEAILKAKNPRVAKFKVPPQGLYLKKVKY